MTDPDAVVPLQPEQLLAVLERHGVDYVLIGGYAAQLHGATRPTNDIDVTPGTAPDNLERLAGALRELGARIRVDAVDGGVPFDVSGESLRGMQMLNLVTTLGELDLTFMPAGTGGYDDLERSAVRCSVGAVHVRLASLQDVIRSKSAAGRAKDLRALPELHALSRTQKDQAEQ